MRLFVVFRTFDRIWTCKTYTRELAPFEMDMSEGNIKLMFMVDQIVSSPDGKEMYMLNSNFFRRNSISMADTTKFYCRSHDTFFPKILKQCKKETFYIAPSNGGAKALMRRFSLPSLDLELESTTVSDLDQQDVIYFVLPKFRCTILLDAHVASCISCECSRSKAFRRHFLHYLRRWNGFRNCVPDYEAWTEEERDAWDNYLSVPYMVDLVAVWPKQKVDYSWNYRVLGQLNKHVVLEEGFAWLSTLGGAHSSLGESFQYHAERAGEISSQQLKLALLLGNESMIARCYVFWAWSLLQRGQLKRCKACILNTWKFCRKNLKVQDTILENMCKAVWSRLRYKKSQLKAKNRKCQKTQNHDVDRDDGSGDGDGPGKTTSSISLPSKEANRGSKKDKKSSDLDKSAPVCLESALKATPVVVGVIPVC